MATKLGVNPEVIREKNFATKRSSAFANGQTINNFTFTDVYHSLKEKSHFDERKKQVEEFNKTHKWKKRGLSIAGAKYGIHYPYIEGVHAQLAVLDDGNLLLLQIDANVVGTVVVSHGAAEIGTGTHTKVIQTVAATLGCSLEKVRITEMNTDYIPQTGWTGYEKIYSLSLFHELTRL